MIPVYDSLAVTQVSVVTRVNVKQADLSIQFPSYAFQELQTYVYAYRLPA